MRTLKSLNGEDEIDTEILIHESEDPEDDCQSDRASNYSHKEEACIFETDTRKHDIESVTHSMPELDKAHGVGESENTKNLLSFSREKFEVIQDPEMFLSTQSRRQSFPPRFSEKNNRFGHVKSWSLLVRVLANKLPRNGKVWRPVLVKLEESTLKFHAEDFESSPPFKVVDLTWFYSFRTPVQAKFNHDEFLFTTMLVNTFHTSRGRLAKCGKLQWKRNGSTVKLGCANHSVLIDLVETVQKCIHSFPAFRQQGIRYRNEKVSVSVKDVYEVSQQEKVNVTVKQVQIMLKAKVSARPECSIHVKHAEGFTKMPAIDEVSFHKCVQSRCSNNQTVAARFLPLDNCWFQLMSWRSCSSRPPPLRCEVTMTVCHGNSSIQLSARMFTGSTHLEVTSVSDVTVRFYIPSEWLRETERKTAVQTVQQRTNVTQGIVSYNPNAETMLWSVSKLSFKPCRNFYVTGKPFASLDTQFKLPSCCNVQEIENVPVEMDFSTKGSAQWSEIEITSMKLGLKAFGKFGTDYSSLYRVVIPVTCSVTSM